MVHDALLSSTNHRIGNMDSCSFGGSLGDKKRSSVDVKVSVGNSTVSENDGVSSQSAVREAGVFMANDVCGDAYGGNPLNGCFLESGMALENGTNPSGGVGDFSLRTLDSKVQCLGLKLMDELAGNTCIPPSPSQILSWPVSTQRRWIGLNIPKEPYELAVMSWNTNGRLNLRGCRESLLRRWALKGFVDVALIQEHFKSDDSPLFNLVGSDWWNISSGAIGKKKGT